MPVKRRLGRHRRQAWSDVHVYALISGHRFFEVFGGHRNPWPQDELQAAWDDLGEVITKAVRAAQPCRRPWAWWQLVLNREMPSRASEQRKMLLSLGKLDARERRLIKADPSLVEVGDDCNRDRWADTMEIARGVSSCR